MKVKLYLRKQTFIYHKLYCVTAQLYEKNAAKKKH